MAKYITIICRVKGETILRLNNESNNSIDNNVYYYSDTKDQIKGRDDNNNRYKYGIDLNQVKREFVDNFDNNFTEYQKFSQSFDPNRTKDAINGSIDANKHLMESHKQYLSTTRVRGRQLFSCQYPNCPYESKWKNAIVNHIRGSHLKYRPYRCDVIGCDRSFTSTSNLSNHKRVHSGRIDSTKPNDNSKPDLQQMLTNAPNCRNGLTEQKGLVQKSNTSFNSDNPVNTSGSKFSNQLKTMVPKKYVLNSNARKTIQTIKSQQKSLINIRPEVETNGTIDSGKELATNQSPRGQSSVKPEPVFVGIKSVEKYIEKSEREGKIWRKCLFPNCDYSSSYSTSIVYHIRNQHLNDRPYKCLHPNCGKAFVIQTNLNNHKKVHKSRKYQ